MNINSNNLNKFIARDKLVLDFENSLDKEFNTATSIINSSISPSEIVECPRRLFFKSVNQYNGVSNKEQRHNEMVINKWIKNLKNCKKCRVLKENACLSDCNYKLVGNVDAIIELFDNLIVVRIKPVKNYDFKQIIKNGAKRKDVVEIMTYIWMAEVKDGILIYENISNNEFRTFRIFYYKPIINSIQKKCLTILEHQRNMSLPLRSYENKNSFECKKCEFINKCWKE